MALVEEDLGSDVLWGAANRVRTLSHDLGKSIIYQLQVTVIANHDIFRLEVAVADIARVEILKDGTNLRSVKSRLLRVEIADRAMVSEQITATQELRSKINVTIILEKPIVAKLFNTRCTEQISGVNDDIKWEFRFRLDYLRRRGGPSY